MLVPESIAFTATQSSSATWGPTTSTAKIPKAVLYLFCCALAGLVDHVDAIWDEVEAEVDHWQGGFGVES
jgi:hypothetical protein